MRLDVLAVIQNLSSNNIVWIVLTVGIIFPVYFLWRDLKKEKKSEYFRTEHVFDFVIIPLILGIFISRLAYILINSSLFQEVRWFWIPYEKIENQILWFETFPWLFFKMNFKTIIVEGFVIGFFAGINFVRKMHHLSWKKISMALSDYVGLLTAFGCWVLYIFTRHELLVYPILILFILFLIKELTKESFDLFKKLTSGIWKIFASVTFPAIVLFSTLRVGFCCILSWEAFLIFVIVVICSVYVIRINYRKKKKVEKEVMKFEKKRIPTKIQKRSYTLSYKTLSGKWWNRLISKFHSDDENTPTNQ